MGENSKIKSKNHIKDLLRAIFPPDQLLLDPKSTVIYGSDASRIYRTPMAVVFPKNTEDVKKLLKLANSFRVPIIPRGRGTNVVGDCVPTTDSIVVSTLLMDRILEIDDKDFVAVVEPGVLTGTLQNEAEKKKLFYPPDPSSSSFSTIGGNVATNAGGLRAVKYGVTKDYVLGLEVVLPGGEVISLGGRFHKNSVGLDLVRLFVGSEGTLGFMTKITLKLLPLPESSASVLVGFENMDSGFEKMFDVFKEGILPVAFEFLDDKISSFFTSKNNITMCFIIKVDGNKASVVRDVERIKKIMKGNCLFEAGITKEEEEKVWEIRRILNQISFRFGKDKLGLDISLPRGKIKNMINFVKTLEQKYKIPILVFGHLGDGNLHINIMYDKKNQDKKALAERISYEIYLFCINLGGSISGEHGIGIVKLNMLKHQLSQKELTLFKKIKSIFDPYHIMNPGKGF